jgi:hypothetical protein
MAYDHDSDMVGLLTGGHEIHKSNFFVRWTVVWERLALRKSHSDAEG